MSDSLADSAERNRRYAEVGCDKPLRHSFNDSGLILQQFPVSLAGSGLKIGKEESGVMAEALESHLQKEILELREIPKQLFKTILVENHKG